MDDSQRSTSVTKKDTNNINLYSVLFQSYIQIQCLKSTMNKPPALKMNPTMVYKRILRKQSLYLLSATLIALSIFQIFLLFRNDDLARIIKNEVIIPKDLFKNEKELGKFVKLNEDYLRYHLSGSTEFNQAIDIDPGKELHRLKYTQYDFTAFSLAENINLDLQQCNKLQLNSSVMISKAVHMKTPLHDVLQNILNDIESGENPYLAGLKKIILPELRLQLDLDVVDKFWFRLAGSSVWLKDYGVHYMVSRIMYSPKGTRNSPLVSLSYAQLYDENWNELVGTRLLVPRARNSPSSEQHILNFPQVVPIPFWQDPEINEDQYYGPEDPRLILIKNEGGYDEPLILYNSYNCKMDTYDDDEDEKLVTTQRCYRAMSACWPWQFDERKYSKTVELKLENYRLRTQKNWTPFTSHLDRQVDGYDSHIYFVFRWANLDILKCDLQGACTYDYRFNTSLSPKNQVGPFRGGTQLINLNDLATVKDNKEVWAGFARAHINDCGCGSSMYRPNLVVIVKERKDSRNHYKVTHISSSLSFDMYVPGWDLLYPENSCLRSSVLIPNGISQWVTDKDSTGAIVEDYLTLTLSVSDYTVHRVNVKGLLKELIKWGVLDYDVMANTHHSNDNLVCALQSSFEFCTKYGLEHQLKKIKALPRDADGMVIDPKKAEYFNYAQRYGLRGVQ
ncbi:Bmt8 beta-mannosyltransferase [Candida orthopsilosis Co 90-125]|uniref:Bmt8 beta-mannosyltransferase n=1 Tax=Candida orthopsilosis (strain 90-125) TaxID=1136231 RepID=H8WXK1_CANO9|nr:Bmt8 beta-mannosyltransferase [Candida orthopsilosis Co 90-125]CCG21507.1 Bmt8 beta-mannosyltransferase [Candida orthopsilosis Co 90-125]